MNLYYAGRDKLPPDETNGNTPLVSAHEVAWYAWTATKDPRMGGLIANGEIKNMIDLCYQTLALADIDGERYRDQIRRNAERILSLQRPDGQWSMRFEPAQPEVEFQTGHALWALQSAGIPRDNPQVAKAIDYLLRRQQPFGGWMDPLQSFENFRTPFRETQMAILALSSYFPEVGRPKGWNAPRIASLSNDPVEMLQQLDDVWDAPSPAVRKQIEAAAQAPDALLRQAAVEALGRLGSREPLYGKLLGDPSKMVQRTAAWAMRQSYSRHTDTPSGDVLAALSSPDDRTRWGATRVFAAHFSALAKRPEIAPALAKLVDDPAETVRMNAVKGLWQFWFWTSDPQAKGPDRGYPAGVPLAGRNPTGWRSTCATASTTWRTRTSATCTTTGCHSWPARKIASAPFAAGWRWNRASPRSSPPSSTRVPNGRRRNCCAA